MKTNFRILAIIIVLMHSCQGRDSEDNIEDGLEIYPVEISQIDKRMLDKWLSFNRESDSIIAAAQLAINQQIDEVETHPQDEREYISTRIAQAQKHLDEFKNKVKFIRGYATHPENWDPMLQQKHDSLKLDYIKEKLKLENALSQFPQ